MKPRGHTTFSWVSFCPPPRGHTHFSWGVVLSANTSKKYVHFAEDIASVVGYQLEDINPLLQFINLDSDNLEAFLRVSLTKMNGIHCESRLVFASLCTAVLNL